MPPTHFNHQQDMTMQFELSALKQRRFKKPIKIVISLDDIDEKGNTKKGEAHFIAHFVESDKDTAKDTQAKLEVLQANILRLKSKHDENPSEETFNAFKALEREGLEVMKAMSVENLAKQFVGFEKHPLHVFPFTEGHEELASTPENIVKLIE